MIKRSGVLRSVLFSILAVAPLAAQEGTPPSRAPFTQPATPRPGGMDSDEAKVFLQALRMISQYHQSSPSDSTLWENALQGLLQELDDPYATVFTPEEYGEFQEDNTGDYAGIGVQITHLAGRVTITAVFRETPAERVGMIVGDQIVWVEGVDATEWSIDDARDAIRGEPGSQVSIRVARAGFPDPIPMTLTRDNVHVSAVATAWVGNVGHIALDRVARGAAEELEAALLEFKDASGIVLDLRRNPGGYLDESLEMADLFLEPGQTLASAEARDRNGEIASQSWQARSPARLPDMPIVVLVDRYTASAAEIVSGALQDYDRAIVIGERTFGKGVVQTVYPLAANRRLRITTGAWHTPLGRSLHRTRDRDGNLVTEDSTEARVVVTPTGRELSSDGGITPDLMVRDDTLRASERALLTQAAKANVPIDVRIEEFAFNLARDARAAGAGIRRLESTDVDPLVDELIAEGVPAEILEDLEARAYLEWRTQIRYLTRGEARGDALAVQADRDKVLAQALTLLAESQDRSELFARVGERKASVPSTGESASR